MNQALPIDARNNWQKLVDSDLLSAGTESFDHPAPRLRPIVAQWIHRLLDDRKLLNAAASQYGSPLNIHHLPSFKRNIGKFRSVFEKHQLSGQIFFARKANRCDSLVLSAHENGIGIDTASLEELAAPFQLPHAAKAASPAYEEKSSAHYVGGLIASGAVKSNKLLYEAARKNVAIIIDNFDELKRLQNVNAPHTRFLLRLSGFSHEGRRLESRFGVPADLLDFFFEKVIPELPSNCEFLGFHFHLTGNSISERISAVTQLCEITRSIRVKFGISVQVFDIGGGLGICHLESEQEWIAFKSALAQAALGKRSPFTFENRTFGYAVHEGVLVGQLKLYPFFFARPAELGLDDILSALNEAGRSLAEQIRELGVELWLEPGRGLLDQCGISVARIAHRKRDSQGRLLIGIEMNHTQLMSGSEEFCSDPILISHIESSQSPSSPQQAVEAYITGAVCIERDFLLKRRVHLPFLPQVGDYIAFINTAAYLMHANEAEAHQAKCATNLVYCEDRSELIEDSVFFSKAASRASLDIRS